jgi:predicted acyl esterase
MLRAWMQESVPPTTRYQHRPGRWVAEAQWPSPNIRWCEYSLAPSRLVMDGAQRRKEHAVQNLQSPLSVGLFAGKWCSYTAAPDLPHDQREEDGGALVYESEPLDEALEILGAPEVVLELTANRPVAMVAARLSDVAPDNKATRVTYGLLNLTRRNSNEETEPLEPGERYRVRVNMNHIAQQFPAGHRLRLSISTSYWPLAWPPPEAVYLSIHTESSILRLPVRAPQAGDELVSFAEPEGAAPPRIKLLEPPHHNWLVHRDLAEDVSVLEVIKDEGSYRIEGIDMEVGDRTWDWYTYQGDDFSSVRGENRTERTFRRGDWSVRTTTRTVLTADATHFYIHAELDAFEGEKRVYSQNWDRTIPRDGV